MLLPRVKISRSEPNYERKSKVINDGLTKLVTRVKKNSYRIEKGKKVYDIEQYIVDYRYLTELSDTETGRLEIEEAERVNHAFVTRVHRLKKRIKNMLLNSNCIFVTLTFRDDVLQNTSSDTRHAYIKRFLNSLNCDYVANIDYGSMEEREHYHALVNCDKINSKDYKLGAINFERVRNTNDSGKLANYISKLTNHAIKETTRGCNIMYSRHKKG